MSKRIGLELILKNESNLSAVTCALRIVHKVFKKEQYKKGKFKHIIFYTIRSSNFRQESNDISTLIDFSSLTVIINYHCKNIKYV